MAAMVASDSVVVISTARLASASPTAYRWANTNTFCAVGSPAQTTTASSCGCERCSRRPRAQASAGWATSFSAVMAVISALPYWAPVRGGIATRRA